MLRISDACKVLLMRRLRRSGHYFLRSPRLTWSQTVAWEQNNHRRTITHAEYGIQRGLIHKSACTRYIEGPAALVFHRLHEQEPQTNAEAHLYHNPFSLTYIIPLEAMSAACRLPLEALTPLLVRSTK